MEFIINLHKAYVLKIGSIHYVPSFKTKDYLLKLEYWNKFKEYISDKLVGTTFNEIWIYFHYPITFLILTKLNKSDTIWMCES